MDDNPADCLTGIGFNCKSRHLYLFDLTAATCHRMAPILCWWDVKPYSINQTVQAQSTIMLSDHSVFTSFCLLCAYRGFPLAWKTWKTPGKLLEFYVRPGILGMISQFTPKCHEKASGCLKYGKIIWRPGLYPRTPLGELTVLFFTANFLQQVLCRFIQSTDIMTAFCHVW